jgi:hypothetical protein
MAVSNFFKMSFRLTRTRKKAGKIKGFLREIGILKTFRKCPYCGEQALWKSQEEFLQVLLL